MIEQLYEDGEIPYVKRPSNDLPESVNLVGSGSLLAACGMWKSFSHELLCSGADMHIHLFAVRMRT